RSLWVNAAFYKAAVAGKQERSARLLPRAYAGLAVLVSVIYGIQRLDTVTEEMAGARKLSVAAVQGNIDIDLKWDPLRAKSNLEQPLNLTNQLDPPPPAICPEPAS